MSGGQGTRPGKVSAWRGGHRGHRSAAGAGAAGQDRAGRGELGRSPGPSLRTPLPLGARARQPPISRRRGDSRCPGPGAAPPSAVTTNGERVPDAVPPARAPESAARRPLRPGSASGRPGAAPRRGRPRLTPGPQGGSAQVGLRFCRWEVGGKTPEQSGE